MAPSLHPVGLQTQGCPDNDTIYVATKAGRRLDPHTADGYNYDNLRAFVERSLQNLEMDSLDLVQLHCPPPEVYDRPAVFAALDRLEFDAGEFEAIESILGS